MTILRQFEIAVMLSHKSSVNLCYLLVRTKLKNETISSVMLALWPRQYHHKVCGISDFKWHSKWPLFHATIVIGIHWIQLNGITKHSPHSVSLRNKNNAIKISSWVTVWRLFTFRWQECELVEQIGDDQKLPFPCNYFSRANSVTSRKWHQPKMRCMWMIADSW